MAILKLVNKNQATLGAFYEDGRVRLPFDNFELNLSLAEASRLVDDIVDALGKGVAERAKQA